MSNTIVNTNVSALNSHRQILSVGGRQSRSSERLSSGQRINRAADDAAGLAISENMRNQIRGLDQATRNSQDGISLVQTAEGALEEVHRMAERIRQLTVQSANDTNSTENRNQIQTEIQQLTDDMVRIANDTQFNGMNLLSGQVSTFGIQSGANSAQRINITITGITAAIDALSATVHTAADLTSGNLVSNRLTNIDTFISSINDLRSNLGAVQNRLEHTINSLSVSSENLSAANSRIRDTDMAAEMMAFTQANVLQQAGMSMLAQANQAPNNILQLVG